MLNTSEPLLTTDLISILNDLTDDEFENFKGHLRCEALDNFSPIKMDLMLKTARQHAVDLMVQKYGLVGAVGVMGEGLKSINRNNLVKQLQAVSSGCSRYELSPLFDGAPLQSLSDIISNTVHDLVPDCDHMWFTEISQTAHSILPTKHVNTPEFIKPIRTVTKTDLISILNDLTDDEFENFKGHLRCEALDNFSPIKMDLLLKTARQHAVDLMVQKYGLVGAVGVMGEGLKSINRNNLVKQLQAVSSGAEGHRGSRFLFFNGLIY
uniref:Pyrin domain-containing protein n=1 Tax=Lates calcarifer TaxID=8187 RepID=A0A4W6FNP6_LATCA